MKECCDRTAPIISLELNLRTLASDGASGAAAEASMVGWRDQRKKQRSQAVPGRVQMAGGADLEELEALGCYQNG